MSKEQTMYFIRHLPLELREKIYKEFIAKTVKERNENGFESIHFSIKNAPYCDINEQITKVLMCYNCFHNELNSKCTECIFNNVDANNLCHLCFKKEIIHHIYTLYNPEPNLILFLKLNFNFGSLTGILIRQASYIFRSLLHQLHEKYQ